MVKASHGTSASSVSRSRPQAVGIHGSAVQQGVSVPCAETHRGTIAKDVSVLRTNHADAQGALPGVWTISQPGLGRQSG